MIPNPIPQEPGFLAVLIHAGTFHHIDANPTVLTKNGFAIPILGVAGTNDPAIWFLAIWWGGKAYYCTSKCDVRGMHYSFESLKLSFEEYPESWAPIAPVAFK